MSWNHSFSQILGMAVFTMTASGTVCAAPPKGPCSEHPPAPHAMPRDPCNPKPPTCCDDPKPGPFAFSFPMDVDLNCPRDFYIYAAGLAFQAKQDGMAFAIRDSDGSGLPINNGTVLNFTQDNSDWDYNPGIRVGIGFYLHHDAWNLDFDWTWLNITNYKSFNAQNSGVVLPIWISPNNAVNSSWTSTNAVWKAHYNTLDARLGKPYHVSRYLILNPHFGVRAGWIDQHFSVGYAGTFQTGSDGITQHGNNDFWGIGARAGLMSDWTIGKGWNLFGNIAAALLFGKFEVDQNLATGSSGNDNGYNLNEDFYQNVPNMEIQLGISWSKYFNRQKYRVQVAAAYEFHEWWDQFNMRKIYGGASDTVILSDTVSRGNLTLNGFSLNLRFDI